MIYRLNLMGLFFNRHSHLFQLQKAEKIMYVKKTAFSLSFLWLFIYGWMSWLGMGADVLSIGANELTPIEYELRKFSFMLGRLAYALLAVLFLLFIPAKLFSLLFKVPVTKIVILQLGTLLILIIERLTWIPLFTYQGLEWYLSPLSLGIATFLLTDLEVIIYFFGTVSLFQFCIIAFQASSLAYLSSTKKTWIWLTTIILHLICWACTAIIASLDHYLFSLL